MQSDAARVGRENEVLQHMSRCASLTTLALASLLAGCGEAWNEPRIFGAVDTALPGALHSATGALLRRDGDGAWKAFCSGTLVAPGLFLSAAHCVRQSEALTVSFDATADGPGIPVTTQEVYRSGNAWYGDLALFTLAREAVGAPVPVAASAPEGDIVVVGYGRTEATGGGRRLATKLSVIEVQPEHAVFLARGEGSGPCQGDSGGPAFAKAQGAWRLVGLVSGGSGRCGRESAMFTQISHFVGWLAERGVR